MSARIHLRVAYRTVERDPADTARRWTAFVHELNGLDGIVIHRTADTVDMAVPPERQDDALELAGRLVDPLVRVEPRLIARADATTNARRAS